MSDFLHHILSPVTPDAPGHAHHGVGVHGVDVAGVTLPSGVVGAVTAVGVLLLGLAVLLWMLRRRTRPWTPSLLATRWAAGVLVTALLLAAPLLTVHATHHLDGDAEGRCAVAGIAHSVAGGLVSAPPSLAPLSSEAAPYPPYLHVDAERLPLAPIARGPPAATAA